jgi:hypothetical protein
VLEADEHHDLDRASDLAKPKFTFTECGVALVLSLTLVTMLAVFLVERIEDVVERGVPDQFLGLILLPLVEKAAEHLTAIDEAWDGQMVSLLSHHLLAAIPNMFAELRPIPLHRPLHPNSPLQRTACRRRWVDHGQRDGPEL